MFKSLNDLTVKRSFIKPYDKLRAIPTEAPTSV